MYDKVKLVLHALPIGYNWQSVLSRIVAYSYRADGTGGWGGVAWSYYYSYRNVCVIRG